MLSIDGGSVMYVNNPLYSIYLLQILYESYPILQAITTCIRYVSFYGWIFTESGERHMCTEFFQFLHDRCDKEIAK